MLKVCRTEATLMNKDASARFLPRQILLNRDKDGTRVR